jgi:NAD+ kinase
MSTIGFVAHPREEARALATETSAWLVEQGHQVWNADSDEARPDLDLAVSIGGDGTMLRTVDLMASTDIPILGVNVGNLGYLTRVEPSGLRAALERFLMGEYTVEPRMTLEVTVTAGERPPVRCFALNDAVIQRTAPGHTVHVRLATNAGPFITYAADTLIVATPTGSTAYNFSARGPILAPGLRALVFTPVAPHLLFDRSLVLEASDCLHLTLRDGRQAELVIDGESHGVLESGDSVDCRAGSHDARLVSFADQDFLSILKAKFGLPDR